MRIPHSFATMKAACVVLLLLTLLPIASHSQSLFDGTWIVVSSKTEDEKPKPISFLVVDGCIGRLTECSRLMARTTRSQ
jgi:hypothetical protein